MVELPWEEYAEPFDVGKMWLANCGKTRDHCRTKQYPLPTRLLCVVDNKVQLVIAESLLEATSVVRVQFT